MKQKHLIHKHKQKHFIHNNILYGPCSLLVTDEDLHGCNVLYTLTEIVATRSSSITVVLYNRAHVSLHSLQTKLCIQVYTLPWQQTAFWRVASHGAWQTCLLFPLTGPHNVSWNKVKY